MAEKYYVYFLSNKPFGVIYVGMTQNLPRRLFEHQNGLIEGFSKKYELKNLIYYEAYATHDEAFTRERQLKKWRRDWKKKLIEENNRDWRDLSEQII